MRFYSAAFLFIFAPMLAHAACLPADLCARVSGLQDVAFGSYSGVGDRTDTYHLCAYVQNDDESDYELTATGSGAGGAFITTNGTTEIPITVEFEEDTAPGFTTLAATVADTFANPDTLDSTCVGGLAMTAKVQVTLDEADLQSATSGSYTGTITLNISPD